MYTANIKNCTKGNTFYAVICEAFSLDDCRNIKEDFNHLTCGTIEVEGISYDWYRNGDDFRFFKAE